MTEYVLVPVPEEAVAEVEQFLRWGGTKPRLAPPWNADTIGTLLDAVDEPTRALVVGVATDLVARDHVTRVHEAAARLGFSDRETLGLVIELNELVKQLIEEQNVAVWPRRGPAEEEDSEKIRNWVIGITDEAAEHIAAIAGAGIDPTR
jgi:hypothetical protein